MAGGGTRSVRTSEARSSGKRGYHARIVAASPSSHEDLSELVSRMARRRPWEPWERPFRFLLDSRVFRLLCDPRQAAALESFRASLARLRLAPEGGLPDLEMTPLAILDAIGVEPPVFPGLPYLPEGMATIEDVEVGIVLREMILTAFRKAPELEAASLKRRVDELRTATDPAAHDLFDLCLTRFVSRDKFEAEILEHLTLDALFTFRFPEEYQERMTHLMNSFLVSNSAQVAGLTKVRRLKVFWEKSRERILRKNPDARGEIFTVGQEMRPRRYKDFLGWEVIHYSVLGYPGKRVDPVVAFTPEPADRLRARCKAHKTALRAFLDEISPEELAGELRPATAAWRPGWLVPCRADGTLEAPVSTGEVGVWVGSGSAT